MQKRILIVRTDRVGDVVMITPMIREIRKTYPDSFIATLTNTNTDDILINNPNLDLRITDDLEKKSFWQVVKKLKEWKFTHGLLVMPTKRAAYQMFLAGIRNRIGVGRKLYEVITFMKSISRNKYIPLRHESDYCMDLARAIGIQTENLTPEIFLSKEEKQFGNMLLKKEGAAEDDFKIIIHTGSGNSSRNWSEEKYFSLIKNVLYAYKEAKIILTAKEMTESLKKKIDLLNSKRIIPADNLIKRLRDLICLIANTNLLISSSTGPLHIAAALNIKTTGLYCHRRMNCATHWGALGKNSINLEVTKQYCDSHCSSDKEVCEFEDGISIDEVLRTISNKL